MDSELGLAVAAAVAGKNKELRELNMSANMLRLLSHGVGLGGTYERVREVVSDINYDNVVWAAINEWAGAQLSEKTGLEIKEISEEGLARAIGRRAGFDLRSLSDMDIVGEDLIAAAAEKIEQRLRVHFGKKIHHVDDLIAALERRAAFEIEKRVPGLVLHNVMDAGVTQSDVEKWATLKVSQKTGIPLRDISDPDKTKQDFIRWAEPELRRRIGVSGSSIGGGLKMTKKAIRNRLASRRFYAAWGSRNQYTSVKGG